MTNFSAKRLGAVHKAPTLPANAAVIWLHGLGADGYDFADVIPSLGLPADHRIRFIFPHAPLMSVTFNGGLSMPAWYDITGIDLTAKQDEVGIRQSEGAVGDLIRDLNEQGIQSENIILIGFSQGGALALHTALRWPEPLGGVAVLSAYLPLEDKLSAEKVRKNQDISIFIAHGLVDTLVPYWLAQRAYADLCKHGFVPDLYTYPIAHTVCPQELQALGQWIQRQFARML